MPGESDRKKLLRQRDPYAVLFPTGRRWFALHWREIRSAVGREGVVALLTYVAALVLLVTGLWVSIDTWAERDVGQVRVPFSGRLWFVDDSIAVDLHPFWIGFLVACGLVGWLLSGQVTKRWLRVFVAFALVVMTLLLITIGRNGNFETAEQSARADARRLLEAEQRTHNEGSEELDGQGEEASTFTVGQALLLSLCEEAGLDEDRCTELKQLESASLQALEENVDQTPVAEQEEPADIQSRRQLRCLEGWTLGAFDRWLEAASYDRRMVALRALASCEIGAPDPAAETVDGSVAEAMAVTPETSVPEGEVDEPPPAGQPPQAEVGAPGDEDGTDQIEAIPSSAASAAVQEALRVQRSEVKAYEAITLGADEVLSFVSGPTYFAEFRFSALAWLVLLGLVFMWYRNLEIRAGARRLGPVDVQFESVEGPNDSSAENGDLRRRPATATEALFKESVIRNVPEPGAVPGSGALAPVGDLVAESDLPQGRLANGVIDLLQRVFATKGGFTVTCSIRSEKPRCAVFVRLRDTRTGHHVISHVFEDYSPERAARLAGYWIAGWIISRSAYVPSWAKWSEDDAASFVNTGWVQGEGLSLTITEATPSDDDLKTVNSLLLAQRAYTHQIGLASQTDRRANHLAALEDFARAVHRQPRYPVARYRRGAVLGTMMLLGGNLARAKGSKSLTVPTTSRLHYLFGDLILGDAGIASEPDELNRWCERLQHGDDFSPYMRRRLLLQVAWWSNQNRAALRWRWLARLRPSERFFWKSFSRGALENDWARVLDLERCIAAERLLALGHELGAPQYPQDTYRPLRLERLRSKLEARAREADSHWQLSYDLAAFYAIRATRMADRSDRVAYCREALNWLERALDRPYSAQLVREWVLADGDLKPLRMSGDQVVQEEFHDLVQRVPTVKPAATLGADDVTAGPVSSSQIRHQVAHDSTDSAVVGPGRTPRSIRSWFRQM